MNQVLIEQFVKLIAQNTGLLIRPQDWLLLQRKLLMRLNALRLSSLEEYYQLLATSIYPKELQLTAAHFNSAMDNGLSTELNGQNEWKQLLQLLTTGESYFFRDSGQIFLLKNIVLPELIAYQKQVWQQQGKERPTLRIWSAGCSTGEEAYSLAILVTELIPDWQSWHLHILGTDINIESIKKARQGVYGDWSFRTVDEQKKTAYFTRLKNNNWQIKDWIKQLVKFEYGNLVKDNFPDFKSDIYMMDLIVCRNVFVYFEAEAIAQVLRKFNQTLRPGGYLFTAHAELYGQQLDDFSAKVFPQSVIYQRPLTSQSGETKIAHPGEIKILHKSPIAGEMTDGRFCESGSLCESANFANSFSSSYSHPGHHPKSHKCRSKHHLINPKSDGHLPKMTPANTPEAVSLSIVPPISEPWRLPSIESDVSLATPDLSWEKKLAELKLLLQTHQYPEAIKSAKKCISLDPKNAEVYYLLAKSLANLGNYVEAEKYCEQAIHLNYNWISPYYLMAGIAEEKGDVEMAKSILKKVIYLFPSSINAYLKIAEIYEKEGDHVRAQKMRFNVILLLEKMPMNTWIYCEEEEEKIKAGELLIYMKKKILAD